MSALNAHIADLEAIEIVGKDLYVQVTVYSDMSLLDRGSLMQIQTVATFEI